MKAEAEAKKAEGGGKKSQLCVCQVFINYSY